jgi:hypothetical protein
LLLLLLLLLLELEEVEGGCGNGRVNPEINCDFMAIFKRVSILLLW